MFFATHRVSLLGGTAKDIYDDPVDSPEVMATGVPASIIESSKRQFNPADARTTRVSYLAGRLPANTEVVGLERLQDENSGDVYIVESVKVQNNPFMSPDIMLELKKLDR